MHIWHPSFRRAEPHGSSQKNFIFLTEDDPPLAGGLTAYRFLADSHGGCPRKPILVEKTPSYNRKSPQAVFLRPHKGIIENRPE